MPSIRDVAREAGVSITTVSRALAGHADVNAATRARVEEVARRIHYRPNVVAQSLVRKQGAFLGVYLDDEGLPLAGQPFFQRVLSGIRDRAARLGLYVLLLPPRAGADLTAIARSTQVHGIIVMGLAEDAPELEALASSDVWTVTIDIEPRGPYMRMITSDNEGQAAEATRHLLAQGCTQVLFVGGKPNTTVHRAREKGYRRALQQWGHDAKPHVVLGHFQRDVAEAAVAAALEDRSFDSVFAASDSMAAGATAAILRAGLRIPEDIAVVGFDDLEIARVLSPPLTSIRQNPELMGSAAVDILHALTAGEEVVPQAIAIPCELVVRESSRKSEQTPMCEHSTP